MSEGGVYELGAVCFHNCSILGISNNQRYREEIKIEYFKEFTGPYKMTAPYYCEGAECATCIHSYGIVDFAKENPDMLCKRASDNCDYRPMKEVVLKKVLGKEQLYPGKFQVITEG